MPIRSLVRRGVTLVVQLLVLPALLLWALDWLVTQVIITPRADAIFTVMGLGPYNSRVVVLGTTLLGAAAGVIGSFALLRKRALIGDVLSHAMLPGIAAAFLVMSAWGATGKSLIGLLVGAVLFGLLGVACVLLIRGTTRLKEDAALGIVLSVFFGLGIAMLGVIQGMSRGNAAGLESFIYGKTASMLLADARLIVFVGALSCWYCLWLFKEFALVCFDQGYAGAQGWPVLLLDALMMALVTAVTVIGLQAVGLILMVAMLIIPPAAARFWTQRLGLMVAMAAGIGALSGYIGAVISATRPRLPAGAIIVVVASSLFLVSLLVGVRRGVLVRLVQRLRLNRKIERQHLLRALFEWQERSERHGPAATAMPWEQLLAARSWPEARLRRALRREMASGHVERVDGAAGSEQWRLTAAGQRVAERLTRNHRLWEIYLITHADVAPSHVDRDADQVEHVLGRELVQRLEGILAARGEADHELTSPHDTAGGARA